MKVKELIERLEVLDGNLNVVFINKPVYLGNDVHSINTCTIADVDEVIEVDNITEVFYLRDFSNKDGEVCVIK